MWLTTQCAQVNVRTHACMHIMTINLLAVSGDLFGNVEVEEKVVT